MISRYDVLLNGKALSGISADIIVLDISYTPASPQTETFDVANRNGARIHRRYYQSASVKITFEIHTYNTQQRQAICNAVQQWARKGGVLECSDRPGQRLRCVCSTFPAIQSAQKWTSPLTIVFTAYQLPFWEDIVPAVLSLSCTAEQAVSGTLYVPGSGDEALVEAEITAGGAMSSFVVNANGESMTLSGLSIGSGGVVKITYDDQMILSIKTGTTSLLTKRTGADDLRAKCGESNTLAFTADVAASVVYRVRGLWV